MVGDKELYSCTSFSRVCRVFCGIISNNQEASVVLLSWHLIFHSAEDPEYCQHLK